MGEAALGPKLAPRGRLEHGADPSLRRPLAMMEKATLVSKLAGACFEEEIADFPSLCRVLVMGEFTMIAELAGAGPAEEIADSRLLRRRQGACLALVRKATIVAKLARASDLKVLTGGHRVKGRVCVVFVSCVRVCVCVV